MYMVFYRRRSESWFRLDVMDISPGSVLAVESVSCVFLFSLFLSLSLSLSVVSFGSFPLRFIILSSSSPSSISHQTRPFPCQPVPPAYTVPHPIHKTPYPHLPHPTRPIHHIQSHVQPNIHTDNTHPRFSTLHPPPTIHQPWTFLVSSTATLLPLLFVFPFSFFLFFLLFTDRRRRMLDLDTGSFPIPSRGSLKL
jgi:hypothetical protein